MNPPAAAVRRSPYFRSGWCRGHGRNEQHPLQPVRQTAWAPELIRWSIASANILKSRMRHLSNCA